MTLQQSYIKIYFHMPHHFIQAKLPLHPKDYSIPPFLNPAPHLISLHSARTMQTILKTHFPKLPSPILNPAFRVFNRKDNSHVAFSEPFVLQNSEDIF